MTALVLSLARALPTPVKQRLRGAGAHRAPGMPLLVSDGVTRPRHKVPTISDELNDLDPWKRNELERRDG